MDNVLLGLEVVESSDGRDCDAAQHQFVEEVPLQSRTVDRDVDLYSRSVTDQPPIELV